VEEEKNRDAKKKGTEMLEKGQNLRDLLKHLYGEKEALQEITAQKNCPTLDEATE